MRMLDRITDSLEHYMDLLSMRQKVVASNIKADDQTGSAHWDADYTFSATKRKVHNSIDAQFEFEGGLIKRHRDSFDLKVWMPLAGVVSCTLLNCSAAD